MTAALATEAAGCIDVAADRLLELGHPLETMLAQVETKPYRLTLFLDGQAAYRVIVGVAGVEEQWLIAVDDRHARAAPLATRPTFTPGWYESGPRVGSVSAVRPMRP